MAFDRRNLEMAQLITTAWRTNAGAITVNLGTDGRGGSRRLRWVREVGSTGDGSGHGAIGPYREKNEFFA